MIFLVPSQGQFRSDKRSCPATMQKCQAAYLVSSLKENEEGRLLG